MEATAGRSVISFVVHNIGRCALILHSQCQADILCTGVTTPQTVAVRRRHIIHNRSTCPEPENGYTYIGKL
jgi:hypothetical protein